MTTAETFAYLRVSSSSQSFDRQLPAFDGLGIPEGHFFHDKISGVKSSRPDLDRLIGKPGPDGKRVGGVARAGDTIWVHSVDRLGRSTSQILETVKALQDRGIQLRAIKSNGIDFEGVNGQLILTIMAALAEWERANTAERVAEARAARTTLGKSTGRKKALSAADTKKVFQMRGKNVPVETIAEKLGVSRATIYRTINPN